MPYLDLGLVRRLAACEGDMVALRQDRLQPLHAVYSIATLPKVEALLQSGEQRLISVFTALSVTWVETTAPLSPLSLNTPDDYQRALQHFDLKCQAP
jgi:molybdopterin-guanine dinucleotide biosynthesis protein A